MKADCAYDARHDLHLCHVGDELIIGRPQDCATFRLRRTDQVGVNGTTLPGHAVARFQTASAVCGQMAIFGSKLPVGFAARCVAARVTAAA